MPRTRGEEERRGVKPPTVVFRPDHKTDNIAQTAWTWHERMGAMPGWRGCQNGRYALRRCRLRDIGRFAERLRTHPPGCCAGYLIPLGSAAASPFGRPADKVHRSRLVPARGECAVRRIVWARLFCGGAATAWACS